VQDFLTVEGLGSFVFISASAGSRMSLQAQATCHVRPAVWNELEESKLEAGPCAPHHCRQASGFFRSGTVLSVLSCMQICAELEP
jgi:hypothetical protein